ncbi:MAG: hypothetical protein WBQ26_12990 [Gemmatimonadaceae bacterium]|nr:hypothetical protein [Gemmatimonadaceae bacterium]
MTPTQYTPEDRLVAAVLAPQVAGLVDVTSLVIVFTVAQTFRQGTLL